MTHTPLLRELLRNLRRAYGSETPATALPDLDRRRFLTRAVRASAGIAAVGALPRFPVARATSRTSGRSIGIVGAGLAGLVCGDELRRSGIAAAIYEGSDRPGGRCFSLRGLFPGQTAERGGELIDNLHKTMIRYAREFDLTLEDMGKQDGEVFYHFDGRLHGEEVITEQFREFVPALRADLRRLSNEITAATHTPSDRALDQISLEEYLDGANALGMVCAPMARAAIMESYVAEYGLSAANQSCLGFLLFIHADRRSRFTPFGVFSDERWHVVEGNDAIVSGLASRLREQIRFGHRLQRIRRASDGRIELTFQQDGGGAVTRVHDYVVVSIPFSILREIDLDPGLDLTPSKSLAIGTLGYGTNAKLMIGFQGPFWRGLGGNGASYSDLDHHQTTWETHPTGATRQHAILTDYSGAERGAALDPADVPAEVQRFLSDLDRVFAGAPGLVRTDATGMPLAHLEHWPSSPFTRGSYTCYRPGQFTTIAGSEGTPEGNLFFAGEHTNSFYEWQGFMEGAALSGLAAARDLRAALG